MRLSRPPGLGFRKKQVKNKMIRQGWEKEKKKKKVTREERRRDVSDVSFALVGLGWLVL